MDYFRTRHTYLSLLLVSSVLSAPWANAANEGTFGMQAAALIAIAPTETAHAGDWQAVEAPLLDDMRGGFANNDGLKISFGIERMVAINGNVVSATHISLPNAEQLGSMPAGSISPGGLTLVQNGAGNTTQISQLASAAATVIQNTLDNQHIQNLTVINAATNSLDFLKGMNLQSTLNDALTRPVGVH